MGYITKKLSYISRDDPDDSDPTKCPKGYFGTYNRLTPTSKDYYNCERCPQGAYMEYAEDVTGCSQCPPGTYGLTTAAEQMNQYNDWEGTPMDPGCMPCPNGTYNTEYGQSECLSCPNGYFCTPFGTVTPTNYDYNSWSSSANMKWTLLPDAEWEMEVPILGPLGEEDIETAVLQMAMLIIILMVLMMLFVKKCMRTKDWEKFKSAIKFVDRKLHISDLAEDGDIDEEEEEEFGAGETEVDYAPKGKLIGGFAHQYFFVVWDCWHRPPGRSSTSTWRSRRS